MPLPACLEGHLELPVIGSPLFIVSGPDLVIAQCKAGIVGSFPRSTRGQEPCSTNGSHRITEELAACDRDHPDRPSAPFAVNQIVHRSNDRLDARHGGVREAARCRSSSPRWARAKRCARRSHSYGGIVLHDVINITLRPARRSRKAPTA